MQADPWGRFRLILIADEPVRRRRRWPFDLLTQGSNFACWDGPRAREDQVCGGGKRIIRKAETDS